MSGPDDENRKAGLPGALPGGAESAQPGGTGQKKPKGKPRGKPFPKGHRPANPGGVTPEKRAFLERLRGEDADTVYDALMALVREGNPVAILRAAEYVAGKPAAAVEDRGALADALTVVVQRIRLGPDGKAE